MDSNTASVYGEILREELVPAMGCTEPIAVAYSAALARSVLGAIPDSVILKVSGNIIKNVKSVIVPHTGSRKGLATAVAAGICFGKEDKELEVLSEASEKDIEKLDKYLLTASITVERSDSDCAFDIQTEVRLGENSAFVRIAGHHTNVIRIEKNGGVIFEKPFTDQNIRKSESRKLLNIKDIVDYADSVDAEEIKDVLERQISCNMRIAEEGMRGSYGAGIGKILLRSYGNSVQNRAKAWAAAGSDARMNGCELPVVINSGSGNQGMTASIPVIIYARECCVSQELLLRALIVSNLVTVHLKDGIGSLSAYCGATSAGAGAGAGICYLYGGRYEQIAHTVVNTLAINSGMICDGAKASCAAKIASAVEAGLLGWQMTQHDSEFRGGDGIIAKGVEDTIEAVNCLARDGMRTTDAEILRLMLQN